MSQVRVSGIGSAPSSSLAGIWELIDTRNVVGSPEQQFLGLDNYSSIFVLNDGIALSTNSWYQMQVSIDNGASWLGSGNYRSIHSVNGSSTLDVAILS